MKMPAHVELAPRAAAADPFAPSATLVAEAGALAPALARIWPRPHASYFAAEPARRHLAAIIVAWSKGETRHLAAQFDVWSLRRLISEYLPDAPSGLAEALRKLGDGGFRREDYAALLSLLYEGGEGAKALRHAERIDRGLLNKLTALPASLRRPRIVALLDSVHVAALVARGAKRACGVIDERAMARLADRLERARSSQGLFRMLIDEIGLEQLAPPPVPGADWLRPLASTRDIDHAARRFENCLKGRIPLLLLGRAAYYEVLGEEPAIVEIVRDLHGLWVVGEVRGHANAEITLALWERIRAHLERHGARVRGAKPDALAIALAQAAGW
jgi:hypothetical protein